MAGAVEYSTLGELSDDLRQMSAETQGVDFTVPLKRSKVAIVAAIKENFAGAHGPDDEPWAPLKHPRPSGRGGDKVLRDKGLLSGSAASSSAEGHVEELSSTTLIMGTNLEYAHIHQVGGVIVPTKAKKLSIPLTKEASRFDSPTQQEGLFYIPGEGGTGFLAEEKETGKGKKRKLEVIRHWILVDQVIIPARPFLGFGQKLIAKIETIFADWWERQVARFRRGPRLPQDGD